MNRFLLDIAVQLLHLFGSCALVFLGLLLTPPPFMIYNEAEGMTENG